MKQEYIPINIRRVVTEQSRGRCVYCQSQTQITGVSLTVEHIIPTSTGGQNTLDNLCLSCWDCNLRKNNRTKGIDPQTGRTHLLFHPKKQKWSQHFRWSDDGSLIIGNTSTGRATIATLHLNREHLVLAREVWVLAGVHPPEL
jgi:uncharacterized protein (TIGR02646 family)